ncbi:MAG TPA: TonB-dependent receptor [Gemmatimonadaceae bacterium]|nr:TonB-dependent receptor [Gemmatimonadaceae bacterium]
MSSSRRIGRTLGVLAAFVALASPLAAQGTVRGSVVDSASQRGIPGVTVIVSGSSSGTVTDDAGRFTLRNVPTGSTPIRAQRIGYALQEKTVSVGAGDTASVSFALRAIAVQLSEVVSIGYGTSSRRDVTSAVSSVTAADIENKPLAGIESAIQGKMAGVQVTQNAGNPGNGISIRVRGPASVNAGNQPLYVVDGIPIIQEDYGQLGMGGQDVTSISSLNPDEIESIDVLKDAAAAAIYGSRGSNGVVIITTKRGRAGASHVNLSTYYGTQSNPRTLALLNAKQYVEIFNESAVNDDEDLPFSAGTDDAHSFDWQSAVFRRAPVGDMQLSMSGGSDRMKYYLSGGSFNQRGIVIGSDYKRQTGRMNIDFDATNRLLLRTSVGLAREDNNRIEGDGSLDGVVTNAIGMQPMRPIFGNFFGYAGADSGLRYSNPLALAAYNKTSYGTLRGLGNVEARYALTNKLALTGRFGADVMSVDELQWESPKVDQTYAQSANGVGKSDHTTATRFVSEAFGTYEALTSDRHKLSLVGGVSTELNHSDLNFIRGEGFTSGFTTYVRNATVITSYDGSSTDNSLASYFGRANYTLLDRYLFSASLRSDRSSRFGADHRWGLFPAASLGWNVSEEPFAAALARHATLKLRASYGVTGNQGIGDFASLSLASGAPYTTLPGIAQTSIGNPDLRWESTRSLDGGADLGLFDNRVSVIADYYARRTNDLLVQRPIAAFTGFTSTWGNVGDVRNSGVDLSINTENLRPRNGRGLGWTSGLNLTFNRNRVMKTYENQPIITGINGRQTTIVAAGQPLGEFYMLKFKGVDPQTGDAIFQDVNGDGQIDNNDKTYVGSPHAKYYGGFSNEFTYGNLALRGFVTFSQGNKIFNMMRIFTDDGACTWDNKTANVLARWQKPGDITDVPRMSYDCAAGADEISSRFIEDGSYVRFSELTLSYQLPQKWANRAYLANARVYVSGHNLKLWTKYSGYDPDVNSAGSDENIIIGTDYYAYPQPRTITFGINAGW